MKLLETYRIKKHSRKVQKHYELLNNAYMQYLGDIIQGSRTENDDELLDYLNKSIAFEPGDKVIDAGCGFAGPAKYFLANNDIDITGVTISPDQFNRITDTINREQLQKLHVIQGDYHFLSKLVPHNNYNRIYFLESFCHCYDPKIVLQEAKKVLKPGGVIYIKDYFINDYLPNNERNNLILSKLNNYYIFRFTFQRFGIESFVNRLPSLGLECIQYQKVAYDENLQKVSEFHGLNNLNGDIDMGCQIDELFSLLSVYEVVIKLS